MMRIEKGKTTETRQMTNTLARERLGRTTISVPEVNSITCRGTHSVYGEGSSRHGFSKIKIR